jgi:hypothetical protein
MAGHARADARDLIRDDVHRVLAAWSRGAAPGPAAD